MTIDAIHFFADPYCPWTWNTSRWLVDVADRLAINITWRTLCLAELNRGRREGVAFDPTT